MVFKNEVYEVIIQGSDSQGEGVARIDGFTVFIPDTMEGDSAKIQIVKVKKNYGYARLLEVLIPAADRVQSPCPVSVKCGGCQLMHYAYPAQLRYKQNKVKEAIVRIGGFTDVLVSDCIGTKEPRRYRNKMVFPVGIDENNRAVFGFYAKRSHRIIPLDDCLIGKEEGIACAKIICDFVNEKKIPVYDEQTKKGLLRRIFIRTGENTSEIMVVISINEDSLPNEQELVKRLTQSDSRIKSIILNSNQKETNEVLGQKNRTLWGTDAITDTIDGLTFEISPNSFYQVNPKAVQTLYQTAVDYAGITKEDRVLDLYCGIGTISLFAARYAKEVIGVEIVQQAVLDAKENAERNEIKNAQFYCGDVCELTEEICRDGIDVVILDPPRKGSDEKTLQAISGANPKRVVYISCEPSTLARDLRFLCDRGYRIDKVTPVDMFPYTSHVETVVLMSRVKE